MKILASTFAEGDDGKLLKAMRLLPYDRILLIGQEVFDRSKSFVRLRRLEASTGHDIDVETIAGEGFMELVDAVSDALARRIKGNFLVLNISGGSKLLGDAALFAAFRLGVESYHCDERLVKLPVIRGATAKDMFTPSQKAFLLKLGEGVDRLDDLAFALSMESRQPAERTLRELKRAGVLVARVADGKIRLALTERGEEVLKVLRATEP